MGLSKTTYKIAPYQILLASSPEVMSPSPYSLFLAHHLPPVTGRVALDLGAGSGILAIVLARQGYERVIATDANLDAVKLTKLNARLNHVSGYLTSLAGDLFMPVSGQKVDVIVCNPPQLPMPQPSTDSKASFYYAGAEGRVILDQLISQASDFLNPGGVLALVTTSLVNIERTRTLLTESGFSFSIVAKKSVQLRAIYFKYVPWFSALARDGKCSFTIKGQRIFETLYVFHATLSSI